MFLSLVGCSSSSRVRETACQAYPRHHFHDVRKAIGTPIAKEALEWIDRFSISGARPPAHQRSVSATSAPPESLLEVKAGLSLARMSAPCPPPTR